MLTLRKLGLFVLLAMIIATGNAVAQDSTNVEQKKLSKEERKQKRQDELRKNMELIQAMVDDSSFVIEANTIRGRHTFSHFVQSNTNFIKVDDGKAIIQTANNFSVGYNGLGGITVEGDIKDYKVYPDEGSVRLIIQLSSAVIGFSTLNMSISADGSAQAVITTGRGGRATFTGDVQALNESYIFEGQSLL